MVEGKAEEVKESASKKIDFSGVAYKMKNNPWMISTAVLVLIVLVLAFKGGVTGNVVSTTTAESSLVAFANSVGVQNMKINSVTRQDSLYLVNASIDGKDALLYITADGKYLVSGVAPLSATPSSSSNNNNAAPKDIPKSDKPVVEAFVFAYCPYGLQFEKALLPVYNLMKNKASINVVYIGAMHGEFEHQESLRQIAIGSLYGNDKLFAYLEKFDANTAIGSCNGADACTTPLIESIFTSLGIDKTKVNDFMAKSSEAIYQQMGARASQLGVSGSPTFVINGVTADVARSSASIESAICSAFNAAPAECSTALSSTETGAGFGGAASSGSASTGTQCATN